MSAGECESCSVLQVGLIIISSFSSICLPTRDVLLTEIRKAAVALHPGAMYRLGTAELNGALSLNRRPKEGVKWLKRSAEHATEEFPHALHELALLHERGIENVVFVDNDYAAELLAQAAELGYAPSAFKLGECYEYGRMGCPADPALSIHYYVSDPFSLFPSTICHREKLLRVPLPQQISRGALTIVGRFYLPPPTAFLILS